MIDIDCGVLVEDSMEQPYTKGCLTQKLLIRPVSIECLYLQRIAYFYGIYRIESTKDYRRYDVTFIRSD